MTREEKAIMYFKDMRKRFCEDYLLSIPKNSAAYKATIAEKEFYDSAIQALEQEFCEDISPIAIPVTVEEAKRLLYTEWKKEVTKDKSNDRLLVAYQIAMKALEQENKIRAEIEQRSYGIANDSVIQGMKYERAEILKIIDKYMSESEEI